MTPEEWAKETAARLTFWRGSDETAAIPKIAAAIRAAVAGEREACAKLAYPKTTHVCSWSECGDCAGKDIADAIRARAQEGTLAPPIPPARQDPGEEIKELGRRPR